MPIPVKYVCPKCKGETDMQGELCVRCSLDKLFIEQGRKNVNIKRE